MTGVFRLLRLPWIVRNIIFRQFEFYDLFNISLCSKKCKTYVSSLKLLKSLKMRIRRVDGLGSPLWGIDLIDKPYNCIWRMDFEKRVESKTKNEYGHRTVDGINMRIRQDGNNFFVVEYGRKMKSIISRRNCSPPLTVSSPQFLGLQLSSPPSSCLLSLSSPTLSRRHRHNDIPPPRGLFDLALNRHGANLWIY
ncbi:hypothetical protein CRE_14026 [Caenorhabditis remanei]|uniref:F-box domain-containing protein n=1 Tax=Caenorhabditis remanei TaxID=31234 RepID=E3M8V5_CAERE|nr:hypothetical protein CRE_14026 [Caenorhabditis remanei]